MTVVDVAVDVLENDTGTQSIRSARNDLEIDIRTVLARVRTRSGDVGLGASFRHSSTVADGVALARSVEALAEHLLGKDQRDVRRLWHELYDRAKRSGAYEALSVLDQALWDLAGKRANEPLYRLLGGATGNIRAYATFPHAKPTEDLLEDAARLSDAGFDAMKVVAGFGVSEDRERIERLAEGLPEEFGLAIDANTAYDFTDAMAVAETAGEHDLLWFEEPVAHTDVAGLADLRERTAVPIAGYQTQSTHYPAVDHLRAEAYDVYQPSLYNGGGVTAASNVSALVEAFNKELVPHAVGPAVNYAASLHVAVASPACSLVEFAVFDDEAEDPGAFVASPYVENQDELGLQEDGTVSPPDAPGLGMTIDEDALAASRVDG